MKKILITNDIHPYLKENLIKIGFKLTEDFTSTKENIKKIISNYDGIILRSRIKLDKEIINHATKLKFIARVGAGLESIDTEFAKKKGIHLISAPEGNKNAVGEHALAMILSLFNNLKQADSQIRNGKWLREKNRGLEIEGKTIGIIGYGNMGKAFAKVLSGFNAKVICYDIKPNVGDKNATQVDLNTLFNQTDILSLHTPHTELTNKMINTSFLEQFKKNIYIINTARGTAIITNDLVNAIKLGKVKGACLDVLEYEKHSFEDFFDNNNLPDAFEYLINSDKVILSPHVAGWTVESKFKLANTILSKIKQFYNLD
jgi:D-3-phosphoglycerate dehydrogenase